MEEKERAADPMMMRTCSFYHFLSMWWGKVYWCHLFTC